MKKGDRVFIHADTPQYLLDRFPNQVGWICHEGPSWCPNCWVVENIHGNLIVISKDLFTLLD